MIELLLPTSSCGTLKIRTFYIFYDQKRKIKEIHSLFKFAAAQGKSHRRLTVILLEKNRNTPPISIKDRHVTDLDVTDLGSSGPRITGRQNGGFVKGWFWRMCSRSGFRSGGTCECTLVPVFVAAEHANVPSFRFFVPGEHLPKPPFWKPPF